MKGTPRVFGFTRESLAFVLGTLVGTAGIALAITTGGCQGAGGVNLQGGDLAVIDGESVPMAEFYKYLAVKQRVRVIDNSTGKLVNGTVDKTLGFQGLEDLIRDRIVRHIAKDEGVYPTEKDVEAEIDFQKKKDPNFLRSVTATGLDLNTIRSQISLQLAAEHVVTKGITVTPSEVDKYIADNPKQFKDPAQADLYWILVPLSEGPTPEKQKKDPNYKPTIADNADSELNSGQNFSVVATHYSQAEGARSHQGAFPQRVIDRLPVGLQNLIRNTGELKSTDWIKTTEGYAKWYVEKITPSHDLKIDSTVKEMVRRQIAIQRGSIANDLDKRVKTKLLGSKIDVKQTYYASLWKDEIENIQSTDKRSTEGRSTGTRQAAPEAKATTP